MIERGVFYLPGPPPVVARERSVLSCGCTVTAGVRVDRQPPEATTAAIPCMPAHRQLMERFNLAFTDTLVNPTTRPLIDVVDEVLAAVTA